MSVNLRPSGLERGVLQRAGASRQLDGGIKLLKATNSAPQLLSKKSASLLTRPSTPKSQSSPKLSANKAPSASNAQRKTLKESGGKSASTSNIVTDNPQLQSLLGRGKSAPSIFSSKNGGSKPTASKPGAKPGPGALASMKTKPQPKSSSLGMEKSGPSVLASMKSKPQPKSSSLAPAPVLAPAVRPTGGGTEAKPSRGQKLKQSVQSGAQKVSQTAQAANQGVRKFGSGIKQTMDNTIGKTATGTILGVPGHVENSAEHNTALIVKDAGKKFGAFSEGQADKLGTAIGSVGTAATGLSTLKDVADGKLDVETAKKAGKTVMDAAATASSAGASGAAATLGGAIANPVYAASALVDAKGAMDTAGKALEVARDKNTPDDLKTIANYTVKKQTKKTGRRVVTAGVATTAAVSGPLGATGAIVAGSLSGAQQVGQKMLKTRKSGGTIQESLLMQKDKVGDRKDQEIKAKLSESGQLDTLSPQQVQAKAAELVKKGKHKEAQALLKKSASTPDGSSPAMSQKEIQLQLAAGNEANRRAHMAEALVCGMEEDGADKVHYENFATNVLGIDKSKININEGTPEERNDLINEIADAMAST